MLKFVVAVLAGLSAFSGNAFVDARGRTCDLACTNACASCVGKSLVDGQWKVSVDFSGCKDGESMSWACCKNPGVPCSVDACDGSVSGSKCDEVTTVDFLLPWTETQLHLQYHDGALIGDVNCSGGGCCGGSGTSCSGALSGVCNQIIELDECEEVIVGPDVSSGFGCTLDSECGVASGPCGTKSCVNGVCVDTFLPSNTVCRASAGPCDIQETCTGSSFDCPVDTFKPVTEVCRDVAGVCDVAETCSGSSADCPADTFKPAIEVCRDIAGVCDVAETCTGSSAACPVDAFKPVTEVCRDVAGVCDVAETCTGSSAVCPIDVVKPNTEVCRVAAGPCDTVEKCDGISVACPMDIFKAQGTLCRGKAHLCDEEEVCTGLEVSCPQDLQRNKGYSYKCANTCYLCGIQQPNLSIVNGGAYKVGSCGIGKCDQFVNLAWPACLTQCVNATCQNNRGLSNIGMFTCTSGTGIWWCNWKIDVSASTVTPICPM